MYAHKQGYNAFHTFMRLSTIGQMESLHLIRCVSNQDYLISMRSCQSYLFLYMAKSGACLHEFSVVRSAHHTCCGQPQGCKT